MGGVVQPDGSDITSLYGGEIDLRFSPREHEYSVRKKGESLWRVVPSVTSINGKTSDKSTELMKWAVKKGVEWFEQRTKEIAEQFQIKRAALMAKGEAGKNELLELYESTLIEMLDEVRIGEWANQIRWAHKNSVNTAASVGTVAHKFAEDVIEWKLGNREKPLPPMNPSAKNAGAAFVRWYQEHAVKFIASESRLYSRKHNYAGTMDIEAEVDGEHCIVDLKTSKDVYEEHLQQISSYSAAYHEATGVRFMAGWVIRIDKDTGSFKAVRFSGDRLAEIGERYVYPREHFNTLQMLRGILDEAKKAGKGVEE